ncbi:MAG: lachnocin family radical SAM-modified peptide [Streptococcaceae bacterium]|nr:lachnocin family radical SAM-modified peptide [Streptococcaceae bacterium]
MKNKQKAKIKLKKVNTLNKNDSLKTLGCHCGCALKTFLAIGKGYTVSQLK